KRSALFKLLEEDPREDFGKHLIPTKVKMGSIAAFAHNGYWEDIGTIESFYQANLALTTNTPPFNLYDKEYPIISNSSHLPGAKITGSQIRDSIICEGSVVEADEVTNSILGQRSNIKKGSIIRSSYIMGNDFYTAPIKTSSKLPDELHIEENCIIQNAIIDRNVFIGRGAQLINKNNLKEFDGPNICVRDGIIVVPRGASIPPGFVF
ncbi:MAG: glucose-1-phosphate adenylyltransferase, partial [Verrucomicrobia bacterium]|nr:glucose-1-phosphate adenylyltransferase [Verrucomicrobiota bacterium]